VRAPPCSSTVPRAVTPARLRVQMYSRPCGETTSTGAPSPRISSARTARPRMRTCDGDTSTPPEPRALRSTILPLARSHTAHHAAGITPTRTRAAHSISSGPNAPTHVHAFNGRPPRHSGIGAGGTGPGGSMVTNDMLPATD
jgi:hypothetical protein